MIIVLEKPCSVQIPNTNIFTKINLELKLNLEQLGINILSDEEILNINIEFLSHDYLTDIITFDLRDKFSQHAELYISIDRVNENAKTFNVDKTEELCRVIIHGLLHLSGLNDNTEEEILVMRKMEQKYLSQLFHVKPL